MIKLKDLILEVRDRKDYFSTHKGPGETSPSPGPVTPPAIAKVLQQAGFKTKFSRRTNVSHSTRDTETWVKDNVHVSVYPFGKWIVARPNPKSKTKSDTHTTVQGAGSPNLTKELRKKVTEAVESQAMTTQQKNRLISKIHGYDRNRLVQMLNSAAKEANRGSARAQDLAVIYHNELNNRDRMGYGGL